MFLMARQVTLGLMQSTHGTFRVSVIRLYSVLPNNMQTIGRFGIAQGSSVGYETGYADGISSLPILTYTFDDAVTL